MRKICLLLLLCLGGCQTTPIEEMSYKEKRALAGVLVDRCIQQGYSKDQSSMRECVHAEYDREQAVRKRNREDMAQSGQALAAGFNSYGEAMRQRPTISCTSNSYGTQTVFTNCQ